MLTAVPKKPLSWSYVVGDGSKQVAAVELAWLQPRGSIALGSAELKIARQGFFSGAFELHDGPRRIVVARSSGTFSRVLEVDAGREHYTLQPAALLSRAWSVTRGKEELGTIRPMGLLSRQALLDCSESIPLDVQLFLLWLVLHRWKRQSG